MRNLFRKLFGHYIRIIVCSCIVILTTVLYLSINNGWAAADEYFNGLFLGGFLNVLIGVLVLVSFGGTFNIFSFYFRRKTLENKHKENYTEYSERKKKENQNYWDCSLPYFFVGLIAILISLIVFVVA